MEKKTDETLFQIYCSLLPNFTKDNYMTFSEFKENSYRKTREKVISDGGKSDDENIEFAKSIMSMRLVEKK